VVYVFTNTLTVLGSIPRHGPRTEGLESGIQLKKSVPSASLPERKCPVGGVGGAAARWGMREFFHFFRLFLLDFFCYRGSGAQVRGTPLMGRQWMRAPMGMKNNGQRKMAPVATSCGHRGTHGRSHFGGEAAGRRGHWLRGAAVEQAQGEATARAIARTAPSAESSRARPPTPPRISAGFSHEVCPLPPDALPPPRSLAKGAADGAFRAPATLGGRRCCRRARSPLPRAAAGRRRGAEGPPPTDAPLRPQGSLEAAAPRLCAAATAERQAQGDEQGGHHTRTHTLSFPLPPSPSLPFILAIILAPKRTALPLSLPPSLHPLF
jgi:hypothetical protein